MKIGFEVGPLAPDERDLVPVLQGVLGTLFSSHPEQEAVLFCTPAHGELFPHLPPVVERVVLPDEQFVPLLARQLARRRLPVLFRCRPREARLPVPLSRQVVLLADLRHEFLPEFFPAGERAGRQALCAGVLNGAGALAALTEHGRQAVRARSRTRDVFVMGPALDAGRPAVSAADLTADERGRLPAGDFFLYPADLLPHKNHRRLLQAFERFSGRAPGGVALVLTGDPAGWDELARGVAGLPVRHLGRVRREFGEVLCRRARALVFFSRYEAFARPLLEAFAAGTPVACGNAGSVGEVAGEAALTCDPTDVEAISRALSRVAHDEGLRGWLVARGRERLARSNWHDGARNLLEACRRRYGRRPFGPLAA
jgi:glycosyltransferase involved in cell wall biosynthesis